MEQSLYLQSTSAGASFMKAWRSGVSPWGSPYQKGFLALRGWHKAAPYRLCLDQAKHPPKNQAGVWSSYAYRGRTTVSLFWILPLGHLLQGQPRGHEKAQTHSREAEEQPPAARLRSLQRLVRRRHTHSCGWWTRQSKSRRQPPRGA